MSYSMRPARLSTLGLLLIERPSPVTLSCGEQCLGERGELKPSGPPDGCFYLLTLLQASWEQGGVQGSALKPS